VVVLVSAMRLGLKPERLQTLREVLGVDRRTVERWREWWLQAFVDSSFWKAARARFMPPLDPTTLPQSLAVAFAVEERRDRLLDLLKFLAPLTAGSTLLAGAV
jgi:glutathione S-transferase